MNPRLVVLVVLQCTIVQLLFFSFVNPAPIPHTTNPKHVIMLIADDLGWNDIGFHGSEIPTPNIDALASTGRILKNYYVGPTCSPSRTEMLTGRYAMRTGIVDPIPIEMPYGLGLDEKLLPQYLKEAGYATHLVGKWHLGHHKKEYTPTYRGYDTHYGCLSGFTDYWDHTVRGGIDFMDGLHAVTNKTNVYRTDLYTERAVEIIRQHRKTQGAKPLFLQVAHQAPHFGEEFAPQQAPKKYVDVVSNIPLLTRKLYAAMVVGVDHSIGELVLALNETGMLNDSLIVFTADNGGAISGQFLSHGSNFPLRGGKGSMWEGGLRSSSFIWHRSLPNPGTVSDIMMHGSDLLPTILAAVNVTGIVKENKNHPLDGHNQWAVLTGESQQQRSSILHGLSHKLYGYRKGDYKVVYGKTKLTSWDGWYKPDSIWEAGIRMLLQYYGLYFINSPTKRETILDGFKNGAGSGATRASHDLKDVQDTRNQVNTILRDLVGQFSNVVLNVSCNNVTVYPACNYGETACLFNVTDDPCEYNNIAATHPTVVAEMLRDVAAFRNVSAKNRFNPNRLTTMPLVWNPWVEDESPAAADTPKTKKECDVVSAAYGIVPTTYTLSTVLVVFSYVLM